jgi:hypothetical protein
VKPATWRKSINCRPNTAEPPRTFAPMISGWSALICRSLTVSLVTRLSNFSASRSSAGVVQTSGIASNVRRARPRAEPGRALRALPMRRIIGGHPTGCNPTAASEITRPRNPASFEAWKKSGGSGARLAMFSIASSANE